MIEAESGAAAVRALTNYAEAVDVVMLDYRLPDSNDLTLLAAIRRLSPSSGVILMTAHGTHRRSQKARSTWARTR